MKFAEKVSKGICHSCQATGMKNHSMDNCTSCDSCGAAYAVVSDMATAAIVAANLLVQGFDALDIQVYAGDNLLAYDDQLSSFTWQDGRTS